MPDRKLTHRLGILPFRLSTSRLRETVVSWPPRFEKSSYALINIIPEIVLRRLSSTFDLIATSLIKRKKKTSFFLHSYFFLFIKFLGPFLNAKKKE